LSGLGSRVLGALQTCGLCSTATWARYGRLALCLSDAQGLHVRRQQLERYRTVIRRLWSINDALGPLDALPELDAEHDAVAMLLGDSVATAIRRSEARVWHEATGECPWCGERGPLHEPGAPE
jgi:hypothetical protein